MVLRAGAEPLEMGVSAGSAADPFWGWELLPEPFPGPFPLQTPLAAPNPLTTGQL